MGRCRRHLSSSTRIEGREDTMNTNANTSTSATERPWYVQLIDAGACPEAIAWAKQYPTGQSAWEACDRPMWLLWWLRRSVPDTQEHRERLACIAIEMVRAIPGRESISDWNVWAQQYLDGTNRTVGAATWTGAEAAAAKMVTWAGAAMRAAMRAATWAATGATTWAAMRAAMRAATWAATGA